MFEKNFNAEFSIKQWANIIRLIGTIIGALSVPAAIIVFCCDPEWYGWISAVVLGGGGLFYVSHLFSSVILWGFGDLVGNTKKIAADAKEPEESNNEMFLPEL